MFRILAGGTLLLSFVFAVLGIAIVSGPPDTEAPGALLPSADCPAPCLLGLRPGVTTAEEAAAILANHPWIRESSPPITGSGTLRWAWNGQQPPLFGRGGGYGEVEIRDGMVYLIRILTPTPFAEFWLLLGAPEKGTIGRSRVMPDTFQTHRAIYPAYGLELKTVILQDGDMKNFWEAPVEILVTTDTDTQYTYTLPCWVACG
ncbi:MAG: hypothetical protein H6671_05125 [Anaerolineaceae bacterium]|nr:hypothetical protein [Anaerolineaceae bacterium]